MQGRCRGRTVFSLMVWSLVAWLSAAANQSVGIAAQAPPANAQGSEQTQKQLIEKGRQAVGEVCVACHNNILRMVQAHKKSAEQWRDTIYSMIGRSAQILPEEIEPLTAFLVANSGRGQSTPSQPAQISGGGRGRGGAGALAPQMPEGEGRAIFQRTCQQCHDPATASTKLASEDWKAVVERMMTYEATLTPADQEKLVEYLSGLAK